MRQLGKPSGAFLFAMRSIFRSIHPSWLVLAALLLIAAYLRFTHADWDGGNQLHPDERAILFVASDLHAPDSLSDAFLAQRSPLNPFLAPDGSSRPYPYGHLPLYLTVMVGHLLHLPCANSDLCASIAPDSFAGRLLNASDAPSYVQYTYIGRALSALFDLLAIIATFVLARRLFDSGAALIAAAMHTVAVIHIQNAHFGTVDLALTLFSTMTVLCLVTYEQSSRKRYSILAGVCAGLALGSKASAIYLAIPILFTHLRLRPSLKLAHMELFWLTAAAAILAFAVTNPYAILDIVPFVTSVVTQAQVTSGAADFPFTRQYSHTLPLIYLIDQQARAFLGLPLTIAICAATVWGLLRPKDQSRPHAVLMVWIITIVLTAGLQYVKFPRYMLPALPAMFALAGGMLSTVHLKTWQRYVLIALILMLTALYAVAFVQMYRTPHPWVAASQWIYREFPPQTHIISELWDDPLPLDLVVDNTGHLREGHVSSVLIHPFAEPDNLEKLNTVSHEIAAADYIILSSNRLYGVIPRLSDRYPLMSAYYRALFAEELGFELERTFSRYPNLFGISLVDNPLAWPALTDPGISWPEPAIRTDYIDESFTIYDHPLVLVFQNIERLSQADIEAIILAHASEDEP